jgi:hypothetical protein
MTPAEAADIIASALCHPQYREEPEARVARIVKLRDCIDEAMLHPSKFAYELFEQMKIYASDAVYDMKNDG